MRDRTSLLLEQKYKQIQYNDVLLEAFAKDVAAFESYLVQEGLWDMIKQKGSQALGGVKNALLQPLIKMILAKVAQSDPEGYKKLQAAAQNPEQLQAMLNSPQVQQQQQQISQDVAVTAESVEYNKEELFEQAINNLIEARVLSNDPRNIRRRERYAQRKGTSKQLTQRANPVANNQTIDKGGANAIRKIGNTLAQTSGKVGQGVQSLAQTGAGKAVGGFISKATNWVKSHPKISVVTALALIAATGGVAAIGAGGIAPLITGALTAGVVGGTKGGLVGGVVGGAKDVYNQLKGNNKGLKDVNWKQAGKAALKTGVKGAAIGAAVGAGANVLGKAALGAKDVISGNYGKAMKGFGPDNALRDLTPGEKRNLGWTDNQPTAGNNKQNWFEIDHQKVIPGEPLSQQQLQTMKIATDMSPNNFSNYEQNLTPEQLKQFKDWYSHWSNLSVADTNAPVNETKYFKSALLNKAIKQLSK